MDNQSSPPEAHTPRQRFWLEHLEACRTQGSSHVRFEGIKKICLGFLAKVIERPHAISAIQKEKGPHGAG